MTDRIPLCLKLNDWPDADRVAWFGLFAAGGHFDDGGPCHDWSEGSRKMRSQSYGQWLSFLLRTDDAAIEIQPSQRITVARLQAFVAELNQRELATTTVKNHVVGLYVLAKAMAPQADWGWLNTAVKRLTNAANRHSLPPPHPIMGPEILRWSLRFMAQTQNDCDLSAKMRAIHFRQGLMIGFLISCPVRRRTLLAMTVNDHVQPISDGYMLNFAAADMKDQKARSHRLPTKLIEPMRLYLEDFRPVLLAGNDTDALWVSQYGEGITPDGLSRELPKVMMRHLEVGIRPHAFRHIAATTIAELTPEHANTIRDILGHATLDMSERHYNRATGISSCNGLQSLVEDIRQSVPTLGRAKVQLTPRDGGGAEIRRKTKNR
jgi:integrase